MLIRIVLLSLLFFFPAPVNVAMGTMVSCGLIESERRRGDGVRAIERRGEREKRERLKNYLGWDEETLASLV